jgi:hypothetical protein
VISMRHPTSVLHKHAIASINGCLHDGPVWSGYGERRDMLRAASEPAMACFIKSPGLLLPPQGVLNPRPLLCRHRSGWQEEGACRPRLRGLGRAGHRERGPPFP